VPRLHRGCLMAARFWCCSHSLTVTIALSQHHQQLSYSISMQQLPS
jgi:hypothetical protein